MDPLSVTAGVIAVAGLAASTGRAFQELRSLCKTLPGKLHALSNEVVDIESVLRQVAAVFEERGNDPVFQAHVSSVPKLLESAHSKLEELGSIIETLSASCRGSQTPLYGAYTWRKSQSRLQGLQEDIQSIKCNLNIILGASNSQDMMRIRLDINTLSAISLEAAQGPANLQDMIQTDLARHHNQIEDAFTHINARVDQRIGAIESLPEAQASQLAASQSDQFGNIYGPRYRRRPKKQAKKGTQHPRVDGNDSIAVRVNHYNSCRPGCLCICHVESRSSTPGFVDRVLGQVFIGYSGLPGLNTKCDVETCQKTQSPNMSFEYWFSLGFVVVADHTLALYLRAESMTTL